MSYLSLRAPSGPELAGTKLLPLIRPELPSLPFPRPLLLHNACSVRFSPQKLLGTVPGLWFYCSSVCILSPPRYKLLMTETLFLEEAKCAGFELRPGQKAWLHPMVAEA